jgi:hypothetical protein
MQCELLWATAGGSGLGANVLNFLSIGGDFDQATVDDIALRIAQFKAATLDAEAILLGGTRFLNDSFSPTLELFADNTNEVGGTAGDLAPAQCSYLINTSAGVGRRKRGRIFWPGVDEAKTENGGALVGTTAADISANFADMVGDIAIDQGWLLGVASRSDSVVRGVLSFQVSSYVHTQRRRSYQRAEA